MPSVTLFERAQRYVAKMPPAVEGQHGSRALLHVACVLVQGFALPRGEARQILDEYNPRCEPPWSERELEHVLDSAEAKPGLETKDGLLPRGCLVGEGRRDDGPCEPALPSRAASAPLPKAAPAKPEFSPERLRAFAARWRGSVDTAWLAERSAILPFGSEGGLSSDAYLRAVFREGEKAVVFTNSKSQGQCLWPQQKIPERGDDGVWYLGQPVDGLEYVNPRAGKDAEGKPRLSRRSEESVVDWRHLVLESDEADAKDWMAALVQMPLAVTAIYTSGGRSIHALVRVDAKSKGNWDGIVKQIRPIFVVLGADPKAMSAVRLTRLPGCWRGDRLQKLLYLNPEPTHAPISTLPVRHVVLATWTKFVDLVMPMTVAEVKEQDGWEDVTRCEAALAWYESSAVARTQLARLREWMRGINAEGAEAQREKSYD